jgi:nodulation protein E
MGDVRFQNGAEISGFSPGDHFEEKQLIPLDRFAQLAVVAARQAVRQAAPEWSAAERQRTAVVTGSCYGGKTSEDEGFREIYGSGEGVRGFMPMTIPRLMANAAAVESRWMGCRDRRIRYRQRVRRPTTRLGRRFGWCGTGLA